MSQSTSTSQSTCSGLTLDVPESALDSVQPAQTPGPCLDPPGFQGPSGLFSRGEETASSPLQVPHDTLSPVATSSSAPVAFSSAKDLSEHNPPTDSRGPPSLEEPEVDAPPRPTEMDTESGGMIPGPGELSPTQPMDQEVDGCVMAEAAQTCKPAPAQLSHIGEAGGEYQPLPNPFFPHHGPFPAGSAPPGDTDVVADPYVSEMESPSVPEDVISVERVQPEGERCSGSDSIPSLAAALLELHELLVSNSHAHPGSQDRSASCSPMQLSRQDADGLDDSLTHEPCTQTPDAQPSSYTAIVPSAEPSDAKANYAALPDDAPSGCLAPGTSCQDEHLLSNVAETAEGPRHPQCSNGSWERREDGGEKDDIGDVSFPGPEPELPASSEGDLEVREPPEGQQGRGVADGRASGTCTPDSLGIQSELPAQTPLQMAVASPEEAAPAPAPAAAQTPPPSSPAPVLSVFRPFTEQFPAEHVQRIQAAGFSAGEAAEALEQAHGVVELALLALLARNITVPP